MHFYTDAGHEIYAQQWHNEPVQAIRAQSGKRKNEELHIYYLTCVCIVQGNILVQMLRSQKHHSQKGKQQINNTDGGQQGFSTFIFYDATIKFR